jgi:hypothetical protein
MKKTWFISALFVAFTFSLAQDQQIEPYDRTPTISLKCYDEKGLDAILLNFGPNACSFIVRSPEGVNDAVRVDYKIILEFMTKNSDQITQTSEDFIPLVNSASSAKFQVNVYDPNFSRRVYRSINKTSFKRFFETVKGDITLQDIETFSESINPNKRLIVVRIFTRVCNSENRCTPEAYESIPAQLE